jgi:serine/threonine-protein kinase
MGVVYKGFDPDIRRVVALKTIRRQIGDGGMDADESAARFRNEAQAAGRLQHPGIVAVYDFGDDGRIAYIAMEYVQGQTLSQSLARKLRYSDADIAGIVGQLLDALQHAHECGVWHRDIKPSNVIITPAGRAKIADFGIARTDNSGLTLAHSVLGTPMYMAPEQFTGRDIDHRVDLYATGVLLYQLVAGRTPFVGPPEVLMYKVVNEVPLAPSQVDGQGRSDRFDSLLTVALAKDRDQRFRSATAFRDALAAALGAPVPAALSAGALPPVDSFAPTERIPTQLDAPAVAPPTAGSMGTGPAIAHWDPAELSRVEAALARHVGPMAQVMVRRAARNCHDLQELQARLAEQITSTSAREAFLGQASRGSAGTGGSQGGSGSSRSPTSSLTGRQPGASGTLSAGHPVSDAWLEQAQKLLAVHAGPIARVVVKRAAEKTRQRDALMTLLAEAAPEAGRTRLLADLAKLK